jgi:hypothetical protein
MPSNIKTSIKPNHQLQNCIKVMITNLYSPKKPIFSTIAASIIDISVVTSTWTSGNQI